MAEAIAERLQGRVGNPELRANSGNISPIEQGRTKDLAAAKAGLGSGKTLEAAQKVIERDIPELVEAMDRGNESVLSLVGGAWAKSVTRGTLPTLGRSLNA